MLILGIVIVASCSSDDSEINVSYESGLGQPDVAIFSSLSDLDTIDYASFVRSPQQKNITRASLGTDIKVYGYTEKTSTPNKTYALGKEFKEMLGIPRNKFYICSFTTAKYVVNIKGLKDRTARFSIVDSPNCGLYPDATEKEYNERGYSMSQNGDQVTLVTKVIHIIASQDGISYDIWFPKKAEDLEWIYNVEEVK